MMKKNFAAAASTLMITACMAFAPLAAEPATESATEALTEGTEEKAAGSFSIADYGSGQALTDEQAIALAYEHAGFTDSQVERQRSEYDEDDGMSILEVEFIVDDDEYDYEIDLDGGRIIKASYDMSERKQRELPLLDASITDSQAADLILEMVPGAAADDMWIEADRDDGIVYYEIDFVLDDVEYNFDVDADAGVITSWEQELRLRRR